MKKSKVPTKKQETWARNHLNKWREKLNLSEWMLSVTFCKKDDHNSHGYTTHAEVNVDPVYLRAHVYIYPAFWELPEHRKNQALIHELCHCFTQEIWDTTTDLKNGRLINDHTIRAQIERLTQRITYCVYS